VNTSFFHQHARFRKKNFIAKLLVDDQIIIDQEGKQEAELQLCENLLGTVEEREHTIDLEAIGLQHQDLSVLEESFSKEEVWDTVKSMPLDKARAPDGTCWHIIKDDIMSALSVIQQGHVARLRLLNTAFITLVPKKPDAIWSRISGP